MFPLITAVRTLKREKGWREREREKGERERETELWQHPALGGIHFAGPSERASRASRASAFICMGKVWFICVLRLGEDE